MKRRFLLLVAAIAASISGIGSCRGAAASPGERAARTGDLAARTGELGAEADAASPPAERPVAPVPPVSPARATSPVGASAGSGVDPHPGALLPLEARFRSSDGAEVALGDVLGRGKPALLVLAYNRCSMLCSLVLRSVSRLMRDFELRPGEDFALVTLSIDPRENVFEAARLQAALLDAAGLPGQTDRWRFLVGERTPIDAVADALGFRYRWDADTEQYAHPAVLFTLSADGRVSGYFDGLDPDRAALRDALASEGSARPSGSFSAAILDCFRFDTIDARYGAAITWSLRGGAAVVGLGVLGLLAHLGRRGRSPLKGRS